MGRAPVPSLRRGHRGWQALGRLMAGFAVMTLVLTDIGAAGQSTHEGAGVACNGTSVAATPNREYLLKAATLYNVAKFTRWPADAFDSADAPLQLCVLGTDPFGDALATVDGKRVGNRNLRTRLITDTVHVAGCHLLFVSASEHERLGDVLASTEGAAILTVADIPDFSRAGGIITLNVVDDRTRFDVNQQAADRAGLTLSAKLLRLAESVMQD